MKDTRRVGGRRILITHADQALGRRVVEHLIEDPSLRRIEAIGHTGSAPPFEARFAREPERLGFHHLDLARHRDVQQLFDRIDVDTVIHLPHEDEPGRLPRPGLADLPPRTSETRLVLQQCLERKGVGQLVALGSSAVYQLAPGNAHRLSESAALDLVTHGSPGARSWVDCDMLLHAEIHHPAVAVALLRVPTIVSGDGRLLMSSLRGGVLQPRAVGFDPMCPLVSERDVVLAIRLALHAGARGTFNIAGSESLPLSVLDRVTQSRRLNLPSPLLEGVGHLLGSLGARGLATRFQMAPRQHGTSLDTGRAARVLGYEPGQRIGMTTGEDGRPRLESTPL